LLWFAWHKLSLRTGHFQLSDKSVTGTSILHLEASFISAERGSSVPRDLELNLSQMSHLVLVHCELTIYICKQLKRPVAFSAVHESQPSPCHLQHWSRQSHRQHNTNECCLVGPSTPLLQPWALWEFHSCSTPSWLCFWTLLWWSSHFSTGNAAIVLLLTSFCRASTTLTRFTWRMTWCLVVVSLWSVQLGSKVDSRHTLRQAIKNASCPTGLQGHSMLPRQSNAQRWPSNCQAKLSTWSPRTSNAKNSATCLLSVCWNGFKNKF